MGDDRQTPKGAQDAETATYRDSVGAERAAGPSAAQGLPAAVGHYRIRRVLGEGGMGTVYEAEQEHPRRIVALKVIKPGWASAELLRRFEQESLALGRLQHPGIAQIHEAATADSGSGPQPYFAMEFIRGDSLLAYAAAHHLNTRQRLELMVKICDAVHHAHQRGIIHRDLKPGNILVDESGQPKVLDFGVARVTDSDAYATRQTDVGQLVGTLAYMSPEQVLADPLELDLRSDVYALGVLLYELLSGHLPYTIGRQIHEAARAIREDDPAPLSSIDRMYRGDIETIVAKSLEKEKVRRYASAADLASDIGRYLKDEPITARPPSTAYQLQEVRTASPSAGLGNRVGLHRPGGGHHRQHMAGGESQARGAGPRGWRRPRPRRSTISCSTICSRRPAPARRPPPTSSPTRISRSVPPSTAPRRVSRASSTLNRSWRPRFT